MTLDSTANKVKVQTVPFYNSFYIITTLLVGTLFFIIALVVYINSTDKKAAGYFHWVVIGTSIIMMTTWGNYQSLPLYGGFFLRAVFHLSYLTTPVVFLNFIFAFPLEKEKEYKTLLVILYIAAVIIAVWQILAFYYTGYIDFNNWVQTYILSFNIGRMFVISCILIALIVFNFFFITTKSVVEKKKLKWLLLGYIIGPGSFVFFWVLPQALTGSGLIPEEYIIMLMSAIPVSFGISIVRYHIMDIDLILKRSFGYSMVIGSLLLIYILLVSLSTLIFSGLSDQISAVAVICLSLLFQPIKVRVQRFVDVKFFRVNYNFRQAIKKLINEITNCNDVKILSERIIKEINNLIPTEKSAFILTNTGEINASILAGNNFNISDCNSITTALATDCIIKEAYARINSVEQGVSINIDRHNYFVNNSLCIIFPIKSSTDQVLAYLVFGKKKSDIRFTLEDVDLLYQVTNAAGITFEKILLNEKLILERFEIEKLEEINQLKSLFVSNVSHEFKTPLTSIKMFADIIRNKGNLPGEKKIEYCSIIEGECNRLTRMIDNVLDTVKIEKGIKLYNLKEINLQEAICNSINVMEYQFKMKNINVMVDVKIPDIIILGDRDAVIEVIVNLLSNAVRYSANDKDVSILLYMENNEAVISIEDQGFGIPQNDLVKIFEPYYRSKENSIKKISGTGLGLSIVKHVMDAHKGRVEVKSRLGTGSCFKLFFPAVNQRI